MGIIDSKGFTKYVYAANTNPLPLSKGRVSVTDKKYRDSTELLKDIRKDLQALKEANDPKKTHAWIEKMLLVLDEPPPNPALNNLINKVTGG